jgi:hypothetical protein
LTHPPGAGPGKPSSIAGLAGWIRTHPVMVVLLVLPVAVLGIPELFGLVYLPGDDLIQNFPLRVLVGQDLRGGILPFFDPYLYSGTPLLGGFNAGAAYPATWLFGFLPSNLAWLLNLSLVYEVALAGMYLFLRRQPMSTAAATIGAATFAFGGFVGAQMVHIDLIEGASWLPWILVAVHALTTPPPSPPAGREGVAGPVTAEWRRRGRWWAGVLAVSAGMSILAGGPESFIDGGTLAAVYLVYRLWSQRLFRRPNRWWSIRSMAATVIGLAGGVALSAAQLLPGLAFVAQSERSTRTYAYFTSGTLPVRSLSLLVAPFGAGTNQAVTGSFAGEYNFPEVTSYLGILALIAACSLFAARWRRRPESRQWWIWYVIGTIGALAALGSHTPFDHLLYLIPGVNAQRLLNRNLLLVDFSLAVLLAWWVHVFLDRRPADLPAGFPPAPGPAGGGPRSAPRPSRTWGELVLICTPVTLIAVVCVLLWTVSAPTIHQLSGIISLSTSHRRWVAVIATAELVIAAFATWVVVKADRFSPDTLRRLVAVVVAVDLGFFTAWSLQPPVSNAVAHATGPMARQLTAATGNGRFIAYDPDLYDTVDLFNLGQTDLSAPNHLASAQGYAALVDNDYYLATGAHLQQDLNPSTLAGSLWDQLNSRVLVAYPGYFMSPVPGSSTPGASIYFSSPFTQWPGAVPASLGHQTVPPTQRHQWYFGGVLSLEDGTVPVVAGSGEGVRVGLIGPTGGTRWLAGSAVRVAPGGGTITFSLPTVQPAAGLVVENRGTGSMAVGVPMVTTTQTGAVLLNGPLQAWVTAPHWVYTGTIGQLGVFHNSRAKGWAWARATGGGAAPAGTRVSAPAPSLDGSQRITVAATGPTTVVRSMAWATGWHASIQPVDPTSGAPTGSATPAVVQPSGVLQQVDLAKAGTYVVTFTYRSGSAEVGLAVSAAAGVALIGWVVAEAVGSRRRRRPRASPPVSPG